MRLAKVNDAGNAGPRHKQNGATPPPRKNGGKHYSRQVHHPRPVVSTAPVQAVQKMSRETRVQAIADALNEEFRRDFINADQNQLAQDLKQFVKGTTAAEISKSGLNNYLYGLLEAKDPHIEVEFDHLGFEKTFAIKEKIRNSLKAEAKIFLDSAEFQKLCELVAAK